MESMILQFDTNFPSLTSNPQRKPFTLAICLQWFFQMGIYFMNSLPLYLILPYLKCSSLYSPTEKLLFVLQTQLKSHLLFPSGLFAILTTTFTMLTMCIVPLHFLVTSLTLL
jgi:hypothetical protein